MSKVYFQCPVCGKISEAKPLYYRSGLKLGAICYCEDAKGIIDIQVKENDFFKLFSKLGIVWALDEIVWEDNKAVVSDGNFIQPYTIVKTPEDYYCPELLDNFDPLSRKTFRRFSTIIKVQKACEEDFAKRKAGNE